MFLKSLATTAALALIASSAIAAEAPRTKSDAGNKAGGEVTRVKSDAGKIGGEVTRVKSDAGKLGTETTVATKRGR